MKISSYEVTDFLKQLALLTKSELPLPSALAQLADESRGKKLKMLIRELSDSAAKGKTLAQAMSEHPGTFPKFYIRLISLGEKEGSLNSVLSELARISRFQYMLVNMIRDVMLYPLITTGIAFFLMILLSCAVIPGFESIYNDLLWGEPLPGATQLVLSVSNFVKSYVYEIGCLYILLVLFSVWLFLNTGLSNKILLKLSRYMPFSEMIFYNLGMARFCSLWAVMTQRKIPVNDSFPVIAEVMDFPELAFALQNTAAKCQKGADVRECLREESNISRLLIMMLENSKEEKLPEELDKLAELFRERGAYGYRRVGMMWELITLTIMVLIAALVILFLFTPFANMLRIF